jgi:hypothetical protein
MRTHQSWLHTGTLRRFVRRRSQQLIVPRTMLPYRPSQQHSDTGHTHPIDGQGINPCPFNHRNQGRRDAEDANDHENIARPHRAYISSPHSAEQRKVPQPNRNVDSPGPHAGFTRPSARTAFANDAIPGLAARSVRQQSSQLAFICRSERSS